MKVSAPSFQTSLDHTQFRQYTSQLARWLSPDPAGLLAVSLDDPQSLNRYAYVLDDPLNLIDLLGLGCTGYIQIVVTPSGSTMFQDPSNCTGGGGFGGGGLGGPHVPSLDAPPVNFPGIHYGGGNSTWAWNFTKAFVNGWFTQGLSDQPGSCTAVFLNSVQNSGGNALRSAATNLQKYGQAVASGLASAGPQAEGAIAATVAGGQLSPAVGAVATNIITGTAPLAVAAAPYVVKVGGYFVVGAFDYVLGKALISELAAIRNGQCKP